MRILYGVSGEGFGHSSRAKEMISYLMSKGHKVLVVTYGQAYSVLKNNFPTIKIEGIHLMFKKGKMSLSRTFLSSLKPIYQNTKNWFKIINKIKSFAPDLCITDFEPFTANASYYLNLPLISIDNQHRLTHLKLKIPKQYYNNFLTAKTAIKFCPIKADAFVILSFVKMKAKSKNAFVVSPILRKSITNLKPTESKSNFILVYQTKPNKTLLKILKQIPKKFVVYGYQKNKREGNIIYRKFGEHFLQDLEKTEAIISTAGFTLMSEALYLKKPYFAMPLRGQFEQTINALFLKEAKFGDFLEIPNKEQIEQFLRNLKSYKSNIKKYKSNPKEAMIVMDKLVNKLGSRKPSA